MAKKPKSEGAIILSRLILMGVLLILSPFFMPSIIFLFFSLIPTIIAYFTDKSKIRYKWLCVGSLNVAGAMPFLFILWFNDDSFKEALRLITEIKNLMIIYGASGIGYLIHLVIPPAVASYVQMSNQRRLVSLKEAMEVLVERWGEDVTVINDDDAKVKKKK